MVASATLRGRPQATGYVSIPFIAGQWSLRLADVLGDAILYREFQSPSLRGSGRFRTSRTPGRSCTTGFNPLHCGAVVASGFQHARGNFVCVSFNPLHCGAVVASFLIPLGILFLLMVSIPFIAGQWSLPIIVAHNHPSGDAFQSPSLRGSGHFPL